MEPERHRLGRTVQVRHKRAHMEPVRHKRELRIRSLERHRIRTTTSCSRRTASSEVRRRNLTCKLVELGSRNHRMVLLRHMLVRMVRERHKRVHMEQVQVHHKQEHMEPERHRQVLRNRSLELRRIRKKTSCSRQTASSKVRRLASNQCCIPSHSCSYRNWMEHMRPKQR